MSTAERKLMPSGLTPEEDARYARERAEFHAEIAADPRPPGPPPNLGPRDEQGRLLPMTDDERKAQAEAIRAMFEEFKRMPDDDPPGAHAAAMRDLDEDRRAMGMRTLFDGRYG